MTFKIPTEFSNIIHRPRISGIPVFKKFELNKARIEAKRKENAFQTLPKLEHISYSPTVNDVNGRQQHHRRHTNVGNPGHQHSRSNNQTIKNHRSKVHNRQRKHRSHRRHNPRHDPLLLKEIALDEKLSTGIYIICAKYMSMSLIRSFEPQYLLIELLFLL